MPVHQEGTEGCMTISDLRDGGHEGRFASDADLAFRIAARRNRLMGLWAGDKLGLTEAEADAYAKAVVQADFEGAGDEDVIRKLMGDLLKAGVEVRDIEIREMLSRMADEARAQIATKTEKAG